MTAPLAGLRVVELARILAGPLIGQTLADLGAEVIKVEAPEGDDTRRWGPFLDRPRPDGGTERVAAYFHAANRGKASVVCDFADPEDLGRLKALIAEADVVVENFKLGGLRRFGLDAETLMAAHPRLICVSVTGFGQTGPRAAQPGYDFLIQGLSGLMDLTGDPEGPPQKVGVAVVDLFTGLYGVIGVQAALAERARSGRGQHVDLSLLDCGVAMLANQAMNQMAGASPRRLGNGHPNIVPYEVFPAADGHVIIACGNDRQFAALCATLGLDGLAAEGAFAANPARVGNRDDLVPRIAAATATRTRAGLIAELERAGVPAGPINSVAEALAEPQVIARGLRIDPEGLPGLRTPLRFSRSGLALDRAAPPLGTGRWSFGPREEG